MTVQQIHKFLEPDLARVESHISAALRSDIGLLDSTNRKLLEKPGKMLRPMLALLVAGAAGTVTEDTVRFAAAAELLHNATLLHDDVVDGATERRGLPTVAKLLGGGPAVLIGDYWLVKCMDEILSAGRESERVLRIFSQTLSHLTEGELLQMEKAGDGLTTQADYLRIIYGKTASLFEATALAGAISAGASAQVTEQMGRFAKLLGTAFQIKDDILDYGEASLGKPVGIDLKEQKITQPLLCVLEKLPADEQASVRRKVAGILDHPEYADEVRALVLENDGPALAGKVMDGYIADAVSCLSVLPQSAAKEALTALAEHVGTREK